MKRILILLTMLLAALPAWGTVKVAVERNVREEQNAEFRFKTVPALSDTDAAQDAAIEVIDGKPDTGCEARQLVDGTGPTVADEAGRTFNFGQNTNAGRIRIDLGVTKPISQINTYSWNAGDRAPQVYTVYGSDGSGPKFLAGPVSGVDPELFGWTKIAVVDSRPAFFMKKDGGGGQYGVGVSDDTGVIGRYRYLLWDIKPPIDQLWSSTKYAEFDVVAADALPPSRLAKIKTTQGKSLEGVAHFDGDTIVVKQGETETRLKLTDIADAAFEGPPVAPTPAEEPSAGGLKAEYFDDQDFKKPRLVRYDSMLKFQWGLGAPDPSVNVDFSARWTGRLEPKFTELYTFQTHAEDGVRLWVDQTLVIDAWNDSPPYMQEGRIALRAGHQHDIRVEYHNRMGEAAMRLWWASANQPKQIVPAARLSPPLDDAASPPRIVLTSPTADRWRVAPGSMELEASVTAPKSEIARVEFFSTNTLLGTVTTPPYKYTWVNVPPGHHRLTARATDAAGTITASLPVLVNVGANGSGSLPPPWGSIRLGAMERRDSSSYSGGMFTMRAGGGELRGAFDSGYFIAQPLDGDGQITVRIGEVSTDATPNAVAGVMLRESLSGDSRYAAILAGKEGTEFLCRREPASWVAANDFSRTVPCYLRLVRLGKLLKAYASENGTSWQLVGSDQLAIGTQAYIGIVSTSRAEDEVSTATIDHVQVQAGAPPMDATVPGVRTRGGSFLAGEIEKSTDTKTILRRLHGRSLTLDSGDIARIYLRPVPLELASAIGRERTGVLLATGDFYEGDFRGIEDGGRVNIESVVFGLKTFENREVLAVVLHDSVEGGSQGEVRLVDGSVYLPKSTKVDGGRLLLTDEIAGEFSVSIREVVALRH